MSKIKNESTYSQIIKENKRSDTFRRIYTIKEIQRILDISQSTAYALIKSNQFHSVKIGSQFRISKKSFDEWLEGMKGDETDDTEKRENI